jgi:GNAT superfamily N-acetyltransferase
LNDATLNKIADFIQRYAPHYTDRELLKEYILKHWEFKTAFVMMDGEEIAAVCRWNISDDGKVAEILDLYIDEKFRGKKIIQMFLQKGLWIFPQVKYIRFERFMKYPNREKSLIPIEKVLKRR